jgi:hypothetical protein
MPTHQRIYTVALAAVLIIPSSAFAWGAKGHQIVALIAEAHLNAIRGTRSKLYSPKTIRL